MASVSILGFSEHCPSLIIFYKPLIKSALKSEHALTFTGEQV